MSYMLQTTWTISQPYKLSAVFVVFRSRMETSTAGTTRGYFANKLSGLVPFGRITYVELL